MSELKKTLTIWKGLALAVSMVIGSGLLGLPGMTLEIGNVYTAAGGWLLISFALIPLIYIFARLGLRFTSSAGLSKYAEESIGAWGGHAVSAVLCGTFAIGIPVLAMIGGSYAQTLLKLPALPVLIKYFPCKLLTYGRWVWPQIKISTFSLLIIRKIDSSGRSSNKYSLILRGLP